MRFPPSWKDKVRQAKRANDYYADMAGVPRLDYSDYNLDKRRAGVKDAERITEAQVNDAIRSFSGSRDDIVLWRNNAGIVDLPSGGRLRYGVGPNGASDWIGYKRVEITTDMVGQKVAVFCAVEAKAPDAGQLPAHQEAFQRAILRQGGIAIVVRSKEDLDQLIVPF